MPVGGHQLVRRRRPGGIYPWAEEALGDAELPEVLEDANGIEVEKVAALAPDLIVGQYSGITEKEYELLSADRADRGAARRLRGLRRAVGRGR